MKALSVGGIVLCGGDSRRMGRPKALLPFGAETMLQRVVRILSDAVRPVVVVAAPEQTLPSLPSEFTIVRDEVRGRGPLQGLAAGLLAFRDDVDAVYVSGCDVPFLKPDFIRRLVALLGDAAVCVPKVGGRFHPLAAVYRTNLLGEVNRLLAQNKLAIKSLLDEVSKRVVSEAELTDVDETLQSLRNLNNLEDYEAAVRLASNTATTSAAD